MGNAERASEKLQAVFFFYSRSRNGDTAIKLLGPFCGYLITNAYAGYKKVAHIKYVLCWFHCRRYFIDSIPLGLKGKEIPGSKGAEEREYIDFLLRLRLRSRDFLKREKTEALRCVAINPRCLLDVGRRDLHNVYHK